jgi:hypothetical protein
LNVHYYAGFVLLAQNLLVFGRALFRRAERLLRMWLVAQCSLLIASLPWLITALGITTGYSDVVDYSPNLVSALFVYLGSFLVGQHFPVVETIPALVWLCLALLAIGLVTLGLSGRDKRTAGVLLAIYLFVLLLLVWANGLNRQSSCSAMRSPRLAHCI